MFPISHMLQQHALTAIHSVIVHPKHSKHSFLAVQPAGHCSLCLNGFKKNYIGIYQVPLDGIVVLKYIPFTGPSKRMSFI